MSDQGTRVTLADEVERADENWCGTRTHQADPEPRGVRCKRRYRVPGTGANAEYERCRGVIDEAHVCSVCGWPPRGYRNEGTR